MTNYSTFGIGDVDALLGGGLLAGSSYLLEIESGTEEDAFIAAFLNGGWSQQELCCLVTYDSPHEELIKRLSEFVDIQRKLDAGALVIIDMWTEAKSEYDLNRPIIMASNPSHINTMERISYELASQVPKRIEGGHFRGFRTVVNSLSSIIMNFKFEPTYRWTRSGLDLTRRSNITTLTLLHPKMFKETTIAAFEQLNDGVIVLSLKELGDKFQRHIRIKRSPITGFSTKIVPYEIIDKRPRLLK